MAHRQEDESTKADHAQKLKDLQNKHAKVTKEANDKHVQETQDQIYKFAEMKAAFATDKHQKLIIVLLSIIHTDAINLRIVLRIK